MVEREEMNIIEHIRRRWMEWQGFSNDEIEDSFDPKYEPPLNLEEECENWEAVISMMENADNHRTEIRRLSDMLKEIFRENGFPEDSSYMVCTRCRIPVNYDDKGNAYCNCHNERPK